MDFEGFSDTYLTQSWATPLSLMPTGTVQVDVCGVWPNEPYFKIKNISPWD
jgi:hypothetical protein